MIRNRLAELLAERQLKITQVSKDTDISRNTITSTSQNDGTMIRLDTINTLCKYLGVTPNEFFEYIPFDFTFHIETNHFNIEWISNDVYEKKIKDIEWEVDFFIDIHKKSIDHSLNLTGKSSFNICDLEREFSHLNMEVSFDSVEDKVIYKSFHDQLSASFLIQVSFEIDKAFDNEFSSEVKKWFQDQDNQDFLSKEEVDNFYNLLSDVSVRAIEENGLFLPY